MKLSYREIEPFVQNPNRAARVVLVYGPDHGLMKERAAQIGKSVVADLNDPFNVIVLSSEIMLEDTARLSDEANAISMMGGDRLVRVEDASDKITPLIKDYLESASDTTLIVLEAGELSPRSTLRSLCEKAKNAAALPCYVEDERDLTRLIGDTVRGAGLQIDRDASSFLAANISGDRLKARGELEKLLTYKLDDQTPISLEDVRAVTAEAGALALDDLVYAVAGNAPDKALRTYGQLMNEGVNFVPVLRAMQNHFRRLHLARALMDEGHTAKEAMSKLSPPVFFKQEAAFTAQLQRWSPAKIAEILERIMALEAQCKTTGAPVETLCAQAILGISASRGG